VLVRVIALLLAAGIMLGMMTGAATQLCASPDVSSAVDDDSSTLDPAVLPEAITVPLPDRRDRVSACAPVHGAPGRLHAAFVFRPPRLVASR
jgi:hypothetical protein